MPGDPPPPPPELLVAAVRYILSLDLPTPAEPRAGTPACADAPECEVQPLVEGDRVCPRQYRGAGPQGL